MDTTAQQVAEAIGNDGTVYKSADGRTLAQVARTYGALVRRTMGCARTGDEAVVYEWADGSAIVDEGCAWDLRHPDCTCGRCWVGGGRVPACVEQALEDAKSAEL